MLFRQGDGIVDHRLIPTAVFSQPPVGTVGSTEERARSLYGEIDVYATSFRPIRHALSGRDERTMMKLVVDRGSQKVVGLHMVGRDAPEIVQGFAVALRAGATKGDFDRTLGIHPTAAEEFVTMRDPRP
jgi:glutathione reductase (NADPH)